MTPTMPLLNYTITLSDNDTDHIVLHIASLFISGYISVVQDCAFLLNALEILPLASPCHHNCAYLYDIARTCFHMDVQRGHISFSSCHHTTMLSCYFCILVPTAFGWCGSHSIGMHHVYRHYIRLETPCCSGDSHCFLSHSQLLQWLSYSTYL